MTFSICNVGCVCVKITLIAFAVGCYVHIASLALYIFTCEYMFKKPRRHETLTEFYIWLIGFMNRYRTFDTHSLVFFLIGTTQAYRVERAKSYTMRITYPQLMARSLQNNKFYLARHHVSVSIQEVNGRSEYSIKSGIEGEEDAYLIEINGDKDLNRGSRYYNARILNVTCYGTGLFHFKASLGDFDSFGDATGHFMLYSEEKGIHDVTFLIVAFLTLTICFILLFCGFIRVRKRLTSHLPIHGDTDKIKAE